MELQPTGIEREAPPENLGLEDGESEQNHGAPHPAEVGPAPAGQPGPDGKNQAHEDRGEIGGEERSVQGSCPKIGPGEKTLQPFRLFPV